MIKKILAAGLFAILASALPTIAVQADTPAPVPAQIDDGMAVGKYQFYPTPITANGETFFAWRLDTTTGTVWGLKTFEIPPPGGMGSSTHELRWIKILNR